MNKKHFIAGFALLVATFLIYSVSASCVVPGSVEEEVERADAVFEGTVLKVEEFDEMNNIVTFEVNGIWKGYEFVGEKAISSTNVIVPKADRVSVGYNYEIDKDYIVYAYDFDNDGQLETNTCTRANLDVADFEDEKRELDVLYLLEIGDVKGEVEIVDEIPSENDDYNLAGAEIKGDYLEVIVNYAGGCEEHEFTLFADEKIIKFLPPRQNIYLIHENNGDSCEAAVNERIIFDLKPLKKQFEVCPLCTDCGEPCTYVENETILNVYDSNREKRELIYIFGENEDNIDKDEDIIEDNDGWFRRIFEGGGCTKEAKLCDDGSSVGRNPDLNCEFDPCPGDIIYAGDAEPVGEQNVVKKFFSWVRGIFS